MSHLAAITTQQAFLFTEFGESFARAKFGDAKVDSLPRFVRGKHAGKLKGLVQWKKVVRGGWVRENSGYMGEGQGHVENRVGKVISAELCSAEWGKEPKALAFWSLDDERNKAGRLARFKEMLATSDKLEPLLFARRFGGAREEMTARINRAHDEEHDPLSSVSVY